ncbi:hypothetical protein CEXT_407761 [Caerostris extrusa]|uniref:Uncharacterized protein n=1 Tax=Caerostris extrusa TaxID=172846 RepID=A0AAV4MTL5_CAEEX|nr:hypothetical protein CEXT_407761 [Caerostris extrusa]
MGASIAGGRRQTQLPDLKVTSEFTIDSETKLQRIWYSSFGVDQPAVPRVRIVDDALDDLSRNFGTLCSGTSNGL